MRAAGQVVDYQTLGLELARRNLTADVGGGAWVSGLTDYCSSLASVRTYAQQVKDAARARTLRRALTDALRSLDDGSSSVDVAAGVHSALMGGMFEDSGIYTMREVLKETWELIEKCQVGTGQVLTGVREMDAGGLTPMPGEYVVIGARPNVGKTMVAMHIARTMAVRGDGVLIASLEMTRALLGVRHLSNHTGVPGENMLGVHGLSKDQMERLGVATEELYKVPVWTCVNRKMDRVVGAARRMHANHGIKALMVDYLGLLDIPDEERRELEIAAASAELANLAHDTGMVVYGLSQLNRGVEHREDQHPRLSDLRESGAIEQDADRVWLLYRPGIGTADDKTIEVCQAKSRNGPAGQVASVPYRGGRIMETRDDEPRDSWRGDSYTARTARED
jgi:replicative DNA helicase